MMILGSPPFMSVITVGLLFFYTDIVMLNPAAVATLFLVSRLIDAINDPIVGYFMDRVPRRKFGKFRFLLIIGTIVCSLNYLLVWLGPAMVPAGKLAVAYVTYLLFGITFDVMDVARNSMLPVITTDRKQRTSLSIYHTIAILIGSVGVSAVVPLVLDAGGKGLGAYQMLIIGVTLFVLFFSIAGTFGVKERVMPAEKNSDVTIKGFLNIFRQRPIYILLIFSILFNLGSSITNGLNLYFFTYIVGDLTVMGTAALISIVGLLPGVILSRVLIPKIGPKKIVIIAMLLNAVFLAVRIISPASIPLIYVCTVFTNFGLGFAFPVVPLLSAECIDYVEYKLHMRSEASMGAIMTFVMKLGGGVGAALPGYMLALTGYIPRAEVQPVVVSTWIIIMTLLVPAAFYLAGLVFFQLGYNLDFSQVSTALTERRAKSEDSDI
jgi:GPH family glycoside/pentoside/hexuronide:cation symporter/glucuronide carrier protein